MLDYDMLQWELQNIGHDISCYDLAKKLKIHVDELLEFISKEVLPYYQSTYKETAMRIPFMKDEEIKEFFQKQIVDLGFLCQTKIIEIKEGMGEKAKIYAHTNMVNTWMLYRGY